MKQNNINNNNKNKNYMESTHLCQGCRGTTRGQFKDERLKPWKDERLSQLWSHLQ